MVIAYYGSVLDETLRGQLKDGLLGAARKEKAEMVLTLAHLTAFEEIPEGFGRVLAETRKAYPAPGGQKGLTLGDARQGFNEYSQLLKRATPRRWVGGAERAARDPVPSIRA